MKKLLIILFIFLVGVSYVTAQSWRLDVNNIQRTLDSVDAGFEVREIYPDIIVFFDNVPINSTDLIGRTSYLLRMIETIMRLQKYDYSQLENYQFFGYNNRNNRDLQLVFPGRWLIEYYRIRDTRVRNEVLIDLFYEQYQTFQMEQRSINPMEEYR